MTLRDVTIDIRKQIIRMHARGKASHIGTSFSCVDIIAVLYDKILAVNPQDPRDPKRDRFLLSKGHGASALYTTLAQKGLIPMDWLKDYFMDKSRLAGHPDRLSVPFVEISAGSLGHGLPIGLGMAYVLKEKKSASRVFVLMSDGEVQEGAVWEAANNASRFGLDNLVAIIDANKLQSYEETDRIMPIASFKDKWSAFGWSVQEVNGHNLDELTSVFQSVPFQEGKPSVVIAHTVKGKGIAEFENKMEWHYRSPALEKVDEYLKELDEKRVH